MMRQAGLILAAGLVLTACGQEQMSGAYEVYEESSYGGQARMQAAPPPPPPPTAMYADDGFGGAVGSVEDADTAETEQAPLLAYSYQTSLELPGETLAETYTANLQACQSAGPAVCMVVQAQITNADGPRPSAYLQLRAAPDWIASFRSGLELNVMGQGGQILSDQTSVEDLTTRIVDTAARVEAQTTLRDRLQQLLETRDGELSDLLAVERELANVQANLDAQASVLAALRQRVNTSMLTLSYQAKREVVEPQTFNPIGQAFKEMGEVFANSVASLILFLAGALPWLVIAVPVISAVIIGFRRLLRKKKAAS